MKNLFIIILTVVVLGSCSKELNQQPISANTTASFFSSSADFVQAVNAIYQDLANYPDRLQNLSEIRSDNVYGVSDGGVRDWEGVNDFWNTLASNTYMDPAWTQNYNGIMRANIVLDQLQKKGSSLFTDLVLRNRLKAESKFLRAFFYFDLVRLFGKVPIFDHPVSNAEALTIPRSPVSDVYNNVIIPDLLYAQDSLPATFINTDSKTGKRTATDLGRATKYAAKSLLALVYMTRSGPTYNVEGPGLGLDEWAQAEALLDDIINSKQYSFLPTQQEIFRYNNEYNGEVIFDINFLSGQTPILGSHFPTNMVPEYFATALGKAVIGGSDKPISGDLLRAFKTGDNRKKSTIHGPFIYNKNVLDTMSFFQKYLDTTAFPATQALLGDWPVNFIVSRYTDVLMLKAECILHGAPGSQLTVDTIVNKVRKRAGLALLPLPANVTLPQLMAERRLEFAGEGTRWHDLVRSGLVTTVIPAWAASGDDKRGKINPFQPEFIIYPVPLTEMNVKVGLYDQNAGYQ